MSDTIPVGIIGGVACIIASIITVLIMFQLAKRSERSVLIDGISSKLADALIVDTVEDLDDDKLSECRRKCRSVIKDLGLKGHKKEMNGLDKLMHDYFEKILSRIHLR